MPDLLQKSESGRCENEAFVRDIPQKVKVEDVKTKLSRETSLIMVVVIIVIVMAVIVMVVIL